MAGEVPEIILKLGTDASGVYAEVDKVKAKYGEIATSVREQKVELAALVQQEKELLKARANAANPTAIIQYNQKLKETGDKINALNLQLQRQKDNLKDSAAQAQLTGGILNKAFDSTLVKGLNGEILATRGNYIKLRTEIANNQGTKEAEALAAKMGEVKRKLDLATVSAQAFSSENKFKETGVLLEDIGLDILKLDFKDAAQRSKILLDLTKQITFKEAVETAKELGETLLNVGKALLANPLFLLATAAVAVYEAFKIVDDQEKALIETQKEYNKIIQKTVDEVDALIRANRDLELQNDIASKKVGKVLGEQLKAKNDFKDEFIRITREQEETIDKINEDFNKKREKDGFKATKNALDALGYETEETKLKKKAIADIIEKSNEERLQLQKKYGLENSKILIDEAQAEIEIIKSLKNDIAKLQSQNVIISLSTAGGENSQANIQSITAERIKELRRASALELKEKLKNVVDQGQIDKITVLETEKLNLEIEAVQKESNNRKLQAAKNVRDGLKKEASDSLKERIDFEKSSAELAIENAELETNGQVNAFGARRDLTIKYYNGLIELAQLNNQDTILLKEQLNSALLKIDKDENRDRFKKADDALAEEERHQVAMFNFQKDAKIKQLGVEITFEEERLQLLEDSGVATQAELVKQRNKVAELKSQLNNELGKLDKEQQKEIIDGLKTVVDASVKAANTILDANLKAIDVEMAAQQRKVDQLQNTVDSTVAISQRGNAQLLELEKKRLADLTKEKQKFVRDQQALAVVELVANTAVMISKAGEEGGAAAAITIGAALLALVAGLASARQIAGQAAFYEGGYTGDGNPREESTAQGQRGYKYHKAEFIHNHVTTKKYLQHFKDIHEGKMDLNEVVHHANLYKMLQANGIDMSREVVPRQNNGSVQDISELKSLMRETTKAIENQDRLKVVIDKNGLNIIASTYIKEQKRLNFLAR